MNARIDLASLKALLWSSSGKALMALAAGCAALLFSSMILVQGDLAASANAAARRLAAEAPVLRKEAEALAKAAKTTDSTSLTSVPAFIDRIGALANHHGTTIGAVRPEGGDEALFRIGLAAPYRALLGFISELEGLDVEVKGFEVKRKALGSGRPTLQASISIRPRNEARDLSIPRLDAVRAALTADAARDPFQALVAGVAAGDGHRLDLSEAYNLTGIATIRPSGVRTATIDLFDYTNGDVLDGRTIVAVEADRVLLNALDAGEGDKYVIRFRRRDNAAALNRASLPAPNNYPPTLPSRRN